MTHVTTAPTTRPETRTVGEYVVTVHARTYKVDVQDRVEDLGHYPPRPGPFLHTRAYAVREWDEIAGHWVRARGISDWYRRRAENAAERAHEARRAASDAEVGK